MSLGRFFYYKHISNKDGVYTIGYDIGPIRNPEFKYDGIIEYDSKTEEAKLIKLSATVDPENRNEVNLPVQKVGTIARLYKEKFKEEYFAFVN